MAITNPFNIKRKPIYKDPDNLELPVASSEIETIDIEAKTNIGADEIQNIGGEEEIQEHVYQALARALADRILGEAEKAIIEDRYVDPMGRTIQYALRIQLVKPKGGKFQKTTAPDKKTIEKTYNAPSYFMSYDGNAAACAAPIYNSSAYEEYSGYGGFSPHRIMEEIARKLEIQMADELLALSKRGFSEKTYQETCEQIKQKYDRRIKYVMSYRS